MNAEKRLTHLLLNISIISSSTITVAGIQVILCIQTCDDLHVGLAFNVISEASSVAPDGKQTQSYGKSVPVGVLAVY